MPSHWNNYLRVDDVDARAAAAAANGGQILVPPTDIPPGRFSTVASPSGATFSLFHEADEATANNPPAGDGSIHWVELHSTDVDADVAWLKSTLGVGTQNMNMPNGGTYHILTSGDVQVGGAMKAMQEGAPSHWLAWVAVDVDACLDRVRNNGGQVFGDAMDMEGIGRMAVCADSTGGVFGVITPAAQH